MKKRIGSRIYDTETAEVVSDVGVGILYRKRTREREWFLLIGDHIEPLDEDHARALLGDDVRYIEEPDGDSVMVRVDREAHRKIAAEAKARGISITKMVAVLADQL